MIGPFIFWDQMGPATFPVGGGINVRPHPHIGLATLTYLFEGEVYHRDSLGSSIAIHPGAVNLMTAGKGIVHSERTRDELKAAGPTLFGIQSWIALPKAKEEIAPAFEHQGQSDLPLIEGEGKEVRIIAGSMWGATAPTSTYSEMIYADVAMTTGSKLPIPAEHDERAVYVAEGTIEIGGDSYDSGQLLVLEAGQPVTVTARSQVRLQVLGGEPMDGPRYIWWNFVSSSKDRIEAAKADWTAGKFDIVPGDEEEFIPLPEK
jgi:redox-sensitive bicupin YhaK (pirin superfamily)